MEMRHGLRLRTITTHSTGTMNAHTEYPSAESQQLNEIQKNT